MSHDNLIDAVRADLGYAPELARLIPGKLVRFSTNSKKNDDSGWVFLFADERGAVYGDHRRGIERTWQDKPAHTLTAHERQRQAREIERSRAERAAEDRRQHDDAANLAAAVWRRGVAFIRHAYIDRKGIGTTGLRMLRADGRSGPFYVAGEAGRVERLRGDLVLVPLYNPDHELRSLQAIDGAGRKSFMKGGKTRGLFFTIGPAANIDPRTFTGDVGIVEGLATGAAVHKLSNMPTFVAFSSGNLKPVAHVVRGMYPRAQIIVAGDVDRSGAGQQAAEAAAAAVGGLVSLPTFTADEIAAGLTDWNDWTRAHRTTPDRMVG